MLAGPDGANAPDSFRWAFLVQHPLWILGALQIVRYRRQARLRYDNRPAIVFT